MRLCYTTNVRRGPKPKGQVWIKWSPEFAYAIGLLVADGCLLNDGRHIDFTSKDRKQVQTFKKCLGLTVSIGTKRSGVGNRRYYRAQFGDVLFYRFLLSIGLSTAKSKTISKVLVPDRYFSDFFRGYFDGDGTSYSFYDSKFPKSFRFYVAFTSASPRFICWLRRQIKDKVQAKGHIVSYPKKNFLQLKYSKQEAISVCNFMYRRRAGCMLRRKYLKIQDSLCIINQR